MSLTVLKSLFVTLLALSVAGCRSGGTPSEVNTEESGAAVEPATAPEPDRVPPPQGDSDGATPGSGEAVAINASHDGQSVELSAGQELILTLEANATTGYSWAVDQIDASILAQQGEPGYAVNNPDPQVIGGGGRAIFRFQAVAPGQSELRLIYHRSWEQGTAPARTFTATIVVN